MRASSGTAASADVDQRLDGTQPVLEAVAAHLVLLDQRDLRLTAADGRSPGLLEPGADHDDVASNDFGF